MLEALLTLAIGAIILLWVDRQNMKEIINRQGRQIRCITGQNNEEDEREKKQRLDDYHYGRIIRQIILEDEYAYLTPDDIIQENANNRFFEIYGYKYVGEVEINKDITSDINIYTSTFDKYIKDIFPNSRSEAIDAIVQKLDIAKLEAAVLFERWQKFYLIDSHQDGKWIPNSPKETLTIEQFKERISATRIDVKKNEGTGLLYFEAGNVKGEVSTEEIPKHPMISLFITFETNKHWLLHEEGSIFQAQAVLAEF